MLNPDSPATPARPPFGWLACLGLVAFVLRLLYATRSGLWRDEALFLDVMRAPTIGDMLDYLRFHESHPPLFYLLTRGWQALVGAQDMALLMLPVLLGVALIPTLYFVGARVFSARAGLLAAALAAVSPILSEHAALIRPYSLLPLLTLVACYGLWRGLCGQRSGWVLYGVLAGLLLLTHNFSWVVIGACGLVSLLWLLATARPWLPALLPWLMAHLAALAIVSPWLPAFKFQLAHAGHAPHAVSSLLSPFVLFVRTFSSMPSPLVATLVLAIAGGCALRSIRHARATGTSLVGYVVFLGVPLLTFLVSALGSAYTELLLPRTLLAVVPCAWLALCAGLVACVPERSQRLLPVLGVALTGAYLAIALFMLAIPKSDDRELAAALSAKVQPDDLILISPEWMASGFNYYFKGNNVQIDYPHEGREGATPFNDLATRISDPAAFQHIKQVLAARRAAGGRIWFVTEVWLTSNQGIMEADLPPGDEIPADVPSSHWNMVGVVRTSQLSRELNRLYGKPSAQLRMAKGYTGEENLTAVLYAPPAGPIR